MVLIAAKVTQSNIFLYLTLTLIEKKLYFCNIYLLPFKCPFQNTILHSNEIVNSKKLSRRVWCWKRWCARLSFCYWWYFLQSSIQRSWMKQTFKFLETVRNTLFNWLFCNATCTFRLTNGSDGKKREQKIAEWVELGALASQITWWKDTFAFHHLITLGWPTLLKTKLNWKLYYLN